MKEYKFYAEPLVIRGSAFVFATYGSDTVGKTDKKNVVAVSSICVPSGERLLNRSVFNRQSDGFDI